MLPSPSFLPSFLPSFDGFLTLLLTFAVRPSVRPSVRRPFAGMFELEMLECEMPFAVLVRSAPDRVSHWGRGGRRPQWVATHLHRTMSRRVLSGRSRSGSPSQGLSNLNF